MNCGLWRIRQNLDSYYKENAMTVELTNADMVTLLESINYSKMRVENGKENPKAVKDENLRKLDSVATKLRAALKGRK
jgi:thiamine pyrophosphate-dependent acetolactate synthase large subunit-like protein